MSHNQNRLEEVRLASVATSQPFVNPWIYESFIKVPSTKNHFCTHHDGRIFAKIGLPLYSCLQLFSTIFAKIFQHQVLLNIPFANLLVPFLIQQREWCKSPMEILTRFCLSLMMPSVMRFSSSLNLARFLWHVSNQLMTHLSCFGERVGIYLTHTLTQTLSHTFPNKCQNTSSHLLLYIHTNTIWKPTQSRPNPIHRMTTDIRS